MSDNSSRLSAKDYVSLMRQRRQNQNVPEEHQTKTRTTQVYQAPPPGQNIMDQAVDQPTRFPTDEEIDNNPNLTTEQKAEVKRRRSAFTESEMFPGQFIPVPEEDILVWEAPSRPYKKRDRQYYTTIAIIVFLLSLILFFAGQFLPIAVVIAIGFLAYVLSAVPPISVKNKITTWGIRIDKEIYYWEELGRFWYTDKFKQKLLHIETSRFPNRITLLLADKTEEEITGILSQVLLKQKPEPTAFDKAADWLQKKVPIDTSDI